MLEDRLTRRHLDILEFIEQTTLERGWPPSVREIADAVGLSSTATVHTHLKNLEKWGYIRRDGSKPRAIEVLRELSTGARAERRPARAVPLVGDVAAGTDVLAAENVEEVYPIPVDFCGEGELFMLRVRGDSMVEAGILDGDYVIARHQDTADNGDIVVAGIPGEEATVKTFRRQRNKIVLLPANPRLGPMEFDPDDVRIYGKVVTVIRRL